MEYTVHRYPNALNSTGYMEIGPGKYSGQHWQSGFLFVWEDAFTLAEGIVQKHFAAYDHFGTNDIPKDSGLAIASDLRSAAQSLNFADATEAAQVLFVPSWLTDGFASELANHRSQMQAMLRAVADELEHAYDAGEFACVLGM